MASCATSLLAVSHGDALRDLCSAMGEHFTGLTVASRHALRLGYIDARMHKTLSKMGLAYAVVRHITAPKVASNAMLLARVPSSPEPSDLEVMTKVFTAWELLAPLPEASDVDPPMHYDIASDYDADLDELNYCPDVLPSSPRPTLPSPPSWMPAVPSFPVLEPVGLDLALRRILGDTVRANNVHLFDALGNAVDRKIADIHALSEPIADKKDKKNNNNKQSFAAG
eukprot:UN4266